MLTSKQCTEIRDLIDNATTIAMCGHASPDWDCVWSCLWFGRIAESLGKKVTYFTATEISAYLQFLPWTETFNTVHFNPKDYDLVLCLDTANQERSVLDGFNIPSLPCKVVAIDHHYSNEFTGCPVYLDTRSSTAEIITQIIEHKDDTLLTEEVATALMLWLMTDTGNFMRWNSPELALRTAATLLEKWADKQCIVKNLYQSNWFDAVRYIWSIIDKAELYKDSMIWSYHIDQELAEEWLASDDVEYAYSVIRSISHPWWFMLCKVILDAEQPYIKCSFRAHANTVDVSLIAQKFWWWWHKAAAACKVFITGTWQETIERVLAWAHEEILQQQS